MHYLSTDHSLPDLSHDELRDGIELEWQWCVIEGRNVFELRRGGWWKEHSLPDAAQLKLRPVVHLYKSRGWTVSVDIEQAPPDPEPPDSEESDDGEEGDGQQGGGQ